MRNTGDAAPFPRGFSDENVFASAKRGALLPAMGFFDRFAAKKPEPTATPTASAENVAAAGAGAKPRLLAAREKLEAKDLPAALAIYEEVLAHSGDRADVLVAISGDLGSHGHVAQIIELVAPRYDAERHGPATGLNLLQAYLAVRNADAAQHVLDILFALERPELEERLHGFSNAIAEMLVDPSSSMSEPGGGGPHVEAPKIAIVSISKPIWFYGLESLAERILPAPAGQARRIAFAQFAVLGLRDVGEAMKKPEEELGRLARALPLWLAETFSFSALYAPIAALGIMQRPEGGNHHVIFGAEWGVENLRQLVDTTEGGLDYVFTGAIRQQSGDYELMLRVWEVKKYRERKTFTARWTPATADTELARLHEQVRVFMEWSAAKTGLPYAAPAHPRAWLETLANSVNLFLADKKLLPADQLPPTSDALTHAGAHAAESVPASLAFLTLRSRAQKLGIAAAGEAPLTDSPLVTEAARALA